jgi:hypothetical protein
MLSLYQALCIFKMLVNKLYIFCLQVCRHASHELPERYFFYFSRPVKAKMAEKRPLLTN